MSLIWLKQTKDTRYEVRSAGNSVRLYTNGVFHSQFNPNTPISGSVWDLLMLPAFFYPAGEIRRVLVLGVGGGTVIRLLNHFVQPEVIVGVELNPVHIQVAKRYFGVNRSEAELVCADAIDWMSDYRGQPFDMIIDDLFFEEEGEPKRAIAASPNWKRQLLSHLTKRGVLVMNFVSAKEMGESGCFVSAATQKRFQSAFRLAMPGYENTVGAFLRTYATSKQLRERLVNTPGLNPQLKSSRLCYSIRNVL